ncbi:MAG: hypothetical protein Q7U53_18120 [Anaerolineaceae bacterium]|nr:hypothetical protein [Anaerolineaceae bacterium]
MIYTTMTKLAMRIAFDVHKDQFDKSGMPYIYHPFYLATQMDTEVSTIVALLHDVVEDSDITFSDLQKRGFSDQVIDALKLLVHDDSTPYLEYVAAIKSNELARKVKLFDLVHNSDITRLNSVDASVKERLEKYEKAIQILSDENDPSSESKLIRDDPIPLDSSRLFFLSIFRNQNSKVVKYSIDVEKANDSHYELSDLSMSRLDDYLTKEYNSKSLTTGLQTFFKGHKESDLLDLLASLDIQYEQLHFDNYE